MQIVETVDIQAPVQEPVEKILTDDALSFLAQLHRRFDERRRSLLQERKARRERIREDPSFPEETQDVRDGDWQVAPVPETIQNRRVEITGPTDAKMMINALNSEADVFMADLEDANSPTWENMAQGQANLHDAAHGRLTHTKDDGTRYELDDDPATLFVRPRGLHLDEPRVTIDEEPASGAFFDAALFLYHNARTLANEEEGPFFYLPKLEGYEEAALWADLFDAAEDELGLEPGTIKATVLLETLPAAFEMEEILYELREHSAGFNAGRWDYIFSVIKTHRDDASKVLPDRSQVTMTVPFMRAYTERLVHVCHKRGAHAIGGMAAFIPSKDPDVNERAFQEVHEDKAREAGDGFDGTWIAHPALADVAREPFDEALGEAPHQIDSERKDVDVQPEDLIPESTLEAPCFGTITEDGLRQNIGVGIRYIESWLQGQGAAALYNLMEDTATAEISRSQVWQWVTHQARLDDGREITPRLVKTLADDELATLRDEIGDDRYEEGRFEDARALFEQIALSEAFEEFLTLPGHAFLEVDA